MVRRLSELGTWRTSVSTPSWPQKRTRSLRFWRVPETRAMVLVCGDLHHGGVQALFPCCHVLGKSSVAVGPRIQRPRDRFDEDCVLGTQFESSRLHHAFRRRRRFPSYPIIAAHSADLLAGALSPRRSLRTFQDVSSPLSPRRNFHFPETETSVRRDTVRMQINESGRLSL
jgi:hypothetical protein